MRERSPGDTTSSFLSIVTLIRVLQDKVKVKEKLEQHLSSFVVLDFMV